MRLAGIVAAGVVLRVLYTVLVAPWPPGLPDDQVFFQLMPDLLADGHGFTQPLLATRGEYVPTAAHPPLYSVVWPAGGAGAVGPTGPAPDRDAVRRGHARGDRAHRAPAGRGSAALVAAALAALYPILITADGALMSESLYGLLVALSLLVAYRLVDGAGVAWALLLGVLVGWRPSRVARPCFCCR